MRLGMHTPRAKSQFTEAEAAEQLGVSVPEFRALIRSHVVETDADLRRLPHTEFQASDLLLLRLLARPPRSGGMKSEAEE
jgi:hypothetical protein